MNHHDMMMLMIMAMTMTSYSLCHWHQKCSLFFSFGLCGASRLREYKKLSLILTDKSPTIPMVLVTVLIILSFPEPVMRWNWKWRKQLGEADDLILWQRWNNEQMALILWYCANKWSTQQCSDCWKDLLESWTSILWMLYIWHRRDLKSYTFAMWYTC